MVSASAAIARSKLDFGLGLVNTDIATAAAIDGSKLDLSSWPTVWTPYTPATITGWVGSLDAEAQFSYLRLGTKTVIVNCHAIGSNTNAVTTSFSTPALGNSVAVHSKYAAAYGVNEAAEVLVKMYVEASSAVIKCTCLGSVNGWTIGTHAREVSGQIIYELA
jgi:hypothetical protein